nr:hypothetical protein [Tanacetum cinerariifolium]
MVVQSGSLRNPGRLVAGDEFPGRHENSNGIPSRATFPGDNAGPIYFSQTIKCHGGDNTHPSLEPKVPSRRWLRRLRHGRRYGTDISKSGTALGAKLPQQLAAIRQLAYSTTPDAFDEYLQMSERTAHDSLTNFTLIVCTGNGKIVQFHGRDNTVGEIKKYTTIMLEAVASQDLWIWHAFFGVAGANNDINILDNSSLFDDFLNDTTLVVPYMVNGVGYEKRRQEGVQKDVERAFVVLQGRWGINNTTTNAIIPCQHPSSSHVFLHHTP